MNPPTQLLLLDINGLFCYKIPKNKAVESVSLEIIELNSYKVIMRPGYREFFDFCYDHYTVGFFTSTNQWNVDIILNKVLNRKQMKNTAFKWYRDRTRFDPDSENSYDTIKKLEDVFDNPVINKERKYHSGNTVLIDDSETKTRFNDPKNILICEPFIGKEDDRILFELMELLPEKFKELF